VAGGLLLLLLLLFLKTVQALLEDNHRALLNDRIEAAEVSHRRAMEKALQDRDAKHQRDLEAVPPTLCLERPAVPSRLTHATGG
jgi:hypothetical protein